jgi:arylsulfatase
LNPDTAGRPVLVKGTTQVLFPGMGRLLENCVLSIKNKSHAVTAGIVVPEDDATGVIICQGANIGGWSLYAHEGKLKYCYNYGGFGNTFVTSKEKLSPGQHQVRMEFAYEGEGLGKGGTISLFVDGDEVAQGKVEATLSNIFSADDGLDVGEDSGAPVSPDYGPVGNHFNGEVKGVQLSIAEGENEGQVVDPKDAVRAMFGRQ